MMRRLVVLTGAVGMLCGAMGCGPAQAVDPETPTPEQPAPPEERDLPLYESPQQAATPPPANGDARVDEAIARFKPSGYSGGSGRTGARTLQVSAYLSSEGFLLKEGRVFYHVSWTGCWGSPSDCSMEGAQELSVAQMEQLVPVIRAHAIAMDWWPIPWEMVELLQRTIATWHGEPLPEEVRFTAAEALPDFVASSYSYRQDAQGRPVMMVAGNPFDLGFLMKEGRVYFHDRWEGCVPNPTECSMTGAAELTLAEMQLLLPNLEARAEALGEPWALAREAVVVLKAAIAAKQP